MTERNSAENKMSGEECMQALVDTINRNMKFKFSGYKDGSKDLISEATRFINWPHYSVCLSSYKDDFENELCCVLKYKLGKLKIKDFEELKSLMSEIHGEKSYYDRIKQEREQVDQMLKELTKKLRDIGGILDNLQLRHQELDVWDVELKKQEILDLVKQKIGYSDSDVEKELSNMMNKILEFKRDAVDDYTITRIYTLMLFGSGYKSKKSMEELKKFGIVDDTHPLPEDYPLIENEIINTMDELLDILSLFYNYV